jgi:hypothetical protein
MPGPESRIAIAKHLVCHDQRADGADQGERCDRGDHDRGRDQSEQHDRADRPPPEEPTGRPIEERNVPEQVKGRAAAESDSRHGVERLANVVERRLQAESKEDDARDHRQVEVAVGVQRKPR